MKRLSQRTDGLRWTTSVTSECSVTLINTYRGCTQMIQTEGDKIK